MRLNTEGEFTHNFRSVANIDYLSSYVFRLAFSDVFAQAVNSEVRSQAFLSNTTGGVFIDGAMSRYQDFQSTKPGDVITILHAPGGEMERGSAVMAHAVPRELRCGRGRSIT